MDYDSWDDMSSEYDNSVEKNSDPIITGFLEEEIRITSNLCKKIIKPNTKYTIIDMGSGTGRVIFSLLPILGENITYCGFDSSKHMIELSSQKKQSKFQKNDKISFLNHDVTDPGIDQLFENDDSVKILLCMYNTLGVIPENKRSQFFESMIRIAGSDGMVLISAFNGDDFKFIAPKLYKPMKKMIKQIDEDSFDEKRLAFKNKLGYYSQWFTKNQILELLQSTSTPIPINISLNNKRHTFGHIFSNRNI